MDEIQLKNVRPLLNRPALQYLYACCVNVHTHAQQKREVAPYRAASWDPSILLRLNRRCLPFSAAENDNKPEELGGTHRPCV